MALDELPVELFQEILNNIKDVKSFITLTLVSKTIQYYLKGCKIQLRHSTNKVRILNHAYLKLNYKDVKLFGVPWFHESCDLCNKKLSLFHAKRYNKLIDGICIDEITLCDNECTGKYCRCMFDDIQENQHHMETYCFNCFNNRPFKYDRKECYSCDTMCIYGEYMYIPLFIDVRYVPHCNNCYNKYHNNYRGEDGSLNLLDPGKGSSFNPIKMKLPG